MRLVIKKSLAAFLLVAFLFPQLIEVIHSIHHKDDIHCTEQNIVHYHEQEHHCQLCDFSFVPFQNQIQGFGITETPIIALFIFSFSDNPCFKKHDFNFSLRAPPVVA